MRKQSIAAAFVAIALQGCLAFDDYNYDGIVYEQPACPNGSCTWSKRIGGSYDQMPRAVTLDDRGDLFVAGRFKGQIGLGPGSVATASAQENSPFAAQYDGQGKPICLYNFPQTEIGEALAILPLGTKLIWGGYFGSPGDNGLAFLRIANGCNASEPLGDTFDVTPVGRISSLVSSVDEGSVYVAGTALGLGEMHCGSNNITFDSNGATLFVSEIEIGSGNCRWLKIYPGADIAPEFMQMIRGGPNRLLVAGSYTGTIEGSPMSNELFRSAFIAAIDTNGGAIQAANVFRAATNDGTKNASFRALATNDQKVFFVGENLCDQMLDITGNPVHACSLADPDAFIATLDLDTLATESVTTIRGSGTQQVTAIAVDEKSGVHLAGSFDTDLDFEAGGVPITCPMGGRCTFLAKLDGFDAASVPATILLLSTAEQHVDANILLHASRTGLALAAGSSVLMTATPENPLPALEKGSYLDVVMARFYPPP